MYNNGCKGHRIAAHYQMARSVEPLLLETYRHEISFGDGFQELQMI
jgi:hypothetical protein